MDIETKEHEEWAAELRASLKKVEHYSELLINDGYRVDVKQNVKVKGYGNLPVFSAEISKTIKKSL